MPRRSRGMSRIIRVFVINSEDPEQIRNEILEGFPAFLNSCKENKETFRLEYSELGNARLERDYGYSIKEFVSLAFFPNPDVKKHKPRSLNVSKGGDT